MRIKKKEVKFEFDEYEMNYFINKNHFKKKL